MNGIDFLKSCSTNVRVIEDALDTQYCLYLSNQARGGESAIFRAVTDLRELNGLCAVVREELWVFRQLGEENEALVDPEKYGLTIGNGLWQDLEPERRAADGRSLREVLLDAIEGSITFSLAREHGIIHTGYFNWTFLGYGKDETESQTGSIDIRLDINLTENGTLYISTRVAPSHLRPLLILEKLSNGSILLGPSGRRAKLAIASRRDDIVLTKSTAVMQPTPSWQSSVCNAMMAEGIFINNGDDWVVVELVGEAKLSRFLWPQKLCFVAENEGSSQSAIVSGDRDWRRWFGSSQDTFRNPLAEAEEWLKGASERDRLSNVAAENAGLDTGSFLPSSINMVAETPLATSPPFNQRLMDQQAALSGIYPTPPDGFIPGQLPHHATSDGVGGAMQVDQSRLSNELQLPSSDDNQLGDSSLGSNGEGQGYQPHSDDLFGDIGEMDFGTNEVGDADFDYFDEPDELPQGTTGDEDVEMGGEAISTHDRDETIDKPHEDVLSDQDAMVTEDLTVPDSRPTSSHEQTGERIGADLSQDPEIEHPKSSPQAAPPTQPVKEPEKPLSPWGIRRHLLPMIPASAVSADVTQPQIKRHNSTFEPIAFNENLDLVSKYTSSTQVDLKRNMGLTSISTPSIALPQKRKKSRRKPAHDPDSGVTDLGSSSEDDSNESATSMSDDEDLPPRLPWDTKKRKRTSWQEQITPTANATDGMWPMEDVGHSGRSGFAVENANEVLHTLLHTCAGAKTETTRGSTKLDDGDSPFASLPAVEDLFEISKLDLVYVAQILGEQAVSAIPSLVASANELSSDQHVGPTSSALETTMNTIAEQVLPSIDDCTISRLALLKEPQRQMMNPGKVPQTGQPRPLQREGSMQLGPDFFLLPPPFIRVRRGFDTWEMLPSALNFWSALGLGPASGTKDVAPVALVPGNLDVVGLMHDFVKELSGVYESRKLGSFVRPAEIDKALTGIEASEDGCVVVSVEDEPLSVESALKAFAETCEDLGKVLASAGHCDPDRTIVILLVDPFEDERLNPYLAACFWKLCKAYRQHIPKAHIKSPRSDLQLQLIPMSLIASPDKIVVLSSQHMSWLATEIYDRCPPSSKAMMSLDVASALPILAAPAVELASLPPKSIRLQLTSDPPSDLLHEGSVLHLAYSLSTDKQWMAVHWIDSTGRYQMATSASLLGKSFQDVAAEIWERTVDILTARDVTWRVFIVSGSEMGPSEAKCWRSLAATKPRRQMLHVTLLSVQTETSLQLSPPSSSDGTNAAGSSGQVAGFLTPGSTPQGTSMTVSPDASGQAAPPTPALTETAASNAENDPDAHLVDITDESWGMLLAPPFTSATSYLHPDDPPKTSIDKMAKGVLFRRGDLHSNTSFGKLESLGVSLHWDIRIRPNAVVDEGPIRQAEVTVREVLRMYRNLGLLGRARNINGTSDSGGVERRNYYMLPVHVASAVKAAKALSWFRV